MPSSPSPQDHVKVLWLIKGLGPGGAEQLLLLSAKVADRERFDYRVAYVRPDKTHLVPEFEALGITPIRLGARLGGKLGWVRELRMLLGEVDVVHAHSPVLASAARVLARTLPRKRRPAVVVTEHSEWSGHQRPTRWLNGITSALDDRRWAVSQQVLDTVWPRRRRHTEVLIHGIDVSAVSADSMDVRGRLRTELGIGADDILAITVANLRKLKDYPNLLQAAKQATTQEPRLRFIAVGQGPLEDEIRQLHQELGLGDRFQLLGFRRDIADLMAASDLFILGSAHEGLPVAIMEAFAAGLPVVATDVGGVPQQVRDGREGLLVAPKDPTALAGAVVRIAGDEDARARMARAAKLRSTDYDIRRAVSEQERVYAELAGVAPGPAPSPAYPRDHLTSE